MSSTAEPDLPDLPALLGRVLQRVARAQQPLLIVIAERMAAARYRGWADQSVDVGRRSRLLACANREEEIAGRIESLFPDAATAQRDMLAANPDLDEINRSIFAGRPLEQQLAIQARGERLGAATWRAFAGDARNAETRQTFLTCAGLEEESAVVLESILRGQPVE
jgi:hypothetical protein